ncbi:hypothetical protein SPONN_1535 [uncultured Candidatus Thioglobus sp.]|nr:hypothetical protein SPONN_1535 [uncultured Candidatus Thioglobus sp.]
MLFFIFENGIKQNTEIKILLPSQHAIIAHESKQAGMSIDNYVVKKALADCEV